MTSPKDILLDRTVVLRQICALAFAAHKQGDDPSQEVKRCIRQPRIVFNCVPLFQASQREILKRLRSQAESKPGRVPETVRTAYLTLIRNSDKVADNVHNYMDEFTEQSKSMTEAISLGNQKLVANIGKKLKEHAVAVFDSVHAVICQEIELSPETGRERLKQFNALLASGATTSRHTM